MEQQTLPRKSLPFIIVCLLILTSFFLLAVYPFQKGLASLDREIFEIRDQISKQEIIWPFFKEISNMADKKNDHTLPFPDKARLDRKKTQKVPSLFNEMAIECGLSLVKVDPDIRLLNEKEFDLLSTAILVRGDFSNLRRFLIKLGGIPYLESVEEIHLESVEGGYLFSLRIKLYV